jgi:dihydrolipoamide dehydrogenase
MSDSTTHERHYDVVVIGGGPGGYVAAIRASQLGLRSAIVEREALGGICTNWGCIPSKALLRSAEVLHLIQRANEFGISVGEVQADYAAALERCARVVATQQRGLSFLMRKNKIDVVSGTARLLTANRVRVSGGPEGEQELLARKVIIATGSRLRALPGVELDGRRIISSREVWGIPERPESLLIIGAGPIGVEFATVYAAFGCAVTIVEFLPRLLPLEDEEMSAELARQFTRRGIRLLTSTKVERAAVEGGRVTVALAPAPGGAGQPQTLQVDRVLVSVGFLPNSADLGLEELGVTLSRGFIEVDGQLCTNVPGIYAIGDVTGKLPLAHTAMFQGELCAEVIAGHRPVQPDYLAIPRCTYSQPQVAAVGLTEAQARERGRPIAVGRFPFRPNGKAQAMGERDGQVKIVADERTGEVLGVHMVGPEVTELIAEFALARTLEATANELVYSVHPHPTLSEVIGEAARDVLGEPLHL